MGAEVGVFGVCKLRKEAGHLLDGQRVTGLDGVPHGRGDEQDLAGHRRAQVAVRPGARRLLDGRSTDAPGVSVATEPQPEASAEIDLDRLQALWPAIVDEICKENQMVGAFLREARPTTLEGSRLLVCFPPDAGFSKKTVERHRDLVRGAVGTLAGVPLDIRYELSELAAEAEVPVVLSEDELLERLKDEFGAREIFED